MTWSAHAAEVRFAAATASDAGSGSVRAYWGYAAVVAVRSLGATVIAGPASTSGAWVLAVRCRDVGLASHPSEQSQRCLFAAQEPEHVVS